MNLDQHTELRDLIELLLRDALSDAQREQLQTLAVATPDSRDVFAHYMQIHAGLQWHFRDQPIDTRPDVQISPDMPTTVGVFGRPRATLSRPAVWATLAAGVLFAAYIATISWNMLGKKLPSGTDGNDLAVAEISETSDVEWSSLTPASTRGERADISAGQLLSIQSGLIELQLKQGTTLLIEGPADWKINGENSATLNHGKLVAKVPQQAIGFTLETPTAKIIDLGTEFGVEVKPSGTADVHVVKGLIDVKRAGNSGKPGPGKLRAGQSAHITADGSKVENSPTVPEKFQRLISADKNAPPQAGALKSGTGKGSVVVTFQQGKTNPLVEAPYVGCSDVQLLSWGPDNNFGKRANFDVGNFTGPANSVLRFDLTPLAGKIAKITRARLILNQDQLVRVAASGVVNVHLLAVANRDWVEGNGLSAPPSIKDGATWNQRKPGARWAGAAGASMSSKDYDPRVLAHHEYEAKFFNKPFVFELAGELKFLADWANDDATNAGFLLRNGAEKTANNRITFYSSDFPDVAARPSLQIEYIPATSTQTRISGSNY